jgi:S-adenosylmethionine synthetase
VGLHYVSSSDDVGLTGRHCIVTDYGSRPAVWPEPLA